MLWNKWEACFYCSTFCSSALRSLNPEGCDSSVSGERSCMIEQLRKRNSTELGLTVPRWATKENTEVRSVCVCRGIFWQVIPKKGTVTNKCFDKLPKYNHFEDYCSSSIPLSRLIHLTSLGFTDEEPRLKEKDRESENFPSLVYVVETRAGREAGGAAE